MSDQSFDLSSAAAMLVVIVVALAFVIRLLPALFHVAWSVLPGVLIMVLIVSVLRAMVNRLLG